MQDPLFYKKLVIISNSDNSKTAQQLFLKLSETIQFNAIYMMEVVTKDGNFLVKTDFEARGDAEKNTHT